MGDDVDARVEQALHVRQVEDVRGDLQATLVRFIDDGSIDLGRHLRRRAEIVIDPNLDEVRFERSDPRDRRAGVLGRLTRDDVARDEHPRAIERRPPLGITKRESRSLFPAQTEHARDAVSGVHTQLTTRVRVRVCARLEAVHVGHMRVRGNQSRHDIRAREINHSRACRRLCAGTGADDLAVAHHDGGVGLDVEATGAGARDQGDVDERGRRRRLSANDDSGGAQDDGDARAETKVTLAPTSSSLVPGPSSVRASLVRAVVHPGPSSQMLSQPAIDASNYQMTPDPRTDQAPTDDRGTRDEGRNGRPSPDQCL